MVFRIGRPLEEFAEMVEQALSAETRPGLVARIRAAADHQHQLVHKMWQKVDTTLGFPAEDVRPLPSL